MSTPKADLRQVSRKLQRHPPVAAAANHPRVPAMRGGAEWVTRRTTTANRQAQVSISPQFTLAGWHFHLHRYDVS